MKTLFCVTQPEDEGRLIWRIVRGKMGVSARQLSRAKVANALRLDGVSVHADRRVQAGQTVSIDIYDDAPAYTPEADSAPVNVVYEDEDLIVIDKPAPLATQSSPRQPDNTLENRLAYRWGSEGDFIFRPVNRLDKGTSGLMAVAKHAHAQLILSQQLHTPDFVREYLAVCEGAPEPASGTVALPIAKMGGATVRREVRPDGKPSVTHYRTESTGNGLSLIRLRLETGRTHQIRVHMSAIGCPVAGDFLYGRELQNLPGRFALHSAHMRFVHPETKARMRFDSALPEELARLFHETILPLDASDRGGDEDA
ncbi:MAG: RluA family pseudouridine synthase [Clostridia bacterium]|nr:RluA family pseudouridine synthase [Clostridia bacterium]